MTGGRSVLRIEGSSTPTSRQEPPMSEKPISPLRRRMIEDMSVRKFGEKTQHDYIRHIENFAKFLGRSPDTATGEDLRRYQVHQTETGVQPPSMNSSAVATQPSSARPAVIPAWALRFRSTWHTSSSIRSWKP